MATREERIEAKVHGRYLVRPASERAGGLLFVGFHGYGESAEAHLEEVEKIPGISAWTVIAVQALHPFYNNRTGEVVASWMTRLDRQAAIVDNIHYVSSVVQRERARSTSAPLLVYAGFSQGTAMAYRAAAGAGHPCHGIVALGGDVPPELADRDLTALPRVLIGRGWRDEWYTETKVADDLELLRSKGVECRALSFDGGHEWKAEFRRAVGTFLAKIRAGQSG